MSTEHPLPPSPPASDYGTTGRVILSQDGIAFPESKPPPPITTVLREKLHERHEDLRARAAAVRALQDWVQLNTDKLETLNSQGKPAEICHDWMGAGFSLDFDFLSHDQVMQVIQVFPGNWKKEPAPHHDEPRIHYTLPIGNRLQLRCYAGQPPPNCQIVESEEDVPAIPATKRKVKKLVCK